MAKRSRKRSKNVIPFRLPIHLNIGGIAFLVILIYIVIVFVIYMNKPHISVYEVLDKQILDSTNCVGMVFRNEHVVTANKSGYLNFYHGEGSKISNGEKIYTLDETGEVYNILKESNTDNSLSKDDREMLWQNISDFRNSYSKNQYQTVSNFTYDIDNSLLELANSNLEKNMKKILKNNHVSSMYHTVSSKNSGLISYSIDGYEDVKPENVKADMFSMKDYKKTQLRSTDKVEKGDPVYKMVTDEEWKIVLNLTEDLYKKLKAIENEKQASNATPYIDISMEKENLSLTLPFKTMKKDAGYYAILTLNKYVVHFLNNRFLDISINFATVKGLKIPNSAITEKQFYVVPNSYFTEGGDTENMGLIVEKYDKSGKLTYQFVQADKYYVTQNGDAYIDINSFSDGIWIRNQQTQERYQIGKKKKLKGVFNVNKGYCLFRMIKVIYSNEEYSIVENGLENGVANYDHIVVDSNTITEDAMIQNYKS